MKCNPEKIKQFFESDTYCEEVKRLIYKMLKHFCIEDHTYIITAQTAFLSLEFYEVEETDEIDEDEKIVDFYQLSKLTPKLRDMFIKLMIDRMDKDIDLSDFAETLMVDLKIAIDYSDWKQIYRKHKLEELNSK